MKNEGSQRHSQNYQTGTALCAVPLQGDKVHKGRFITSWSHASRDAEPDFTVIRSSP
jgi:hypothetical protein